MASLDASRWLERSAFRCGTRKKLLGAIAGLRAGEAALSPAKPPPVQLSAERRDLTLLFCDLVDSTSLATRLDRERVHGSLQGGHRPARQSCRESARRRADGVLWFPARPGGYRRTCRSRPAGSGRIHGTAFGARRAHSPRADRHRGGSCRGRRCDWRCRRVRRYDRRRTPGARCQAACPRAARSIRSGSEPH